jgi:hypothetical protein
LIQAIAEDPFAGAVIDGWTRAAATFAKSSAADAAWLRPLWDCWIAQEKNHESKTNREYTEILRSLLEAMPDCEAELVLLDILKQPPTIDGIFLLSFAFELPPILPRPWSRSLGSKFLEAARKALDRPVDQIAYVWTRLLATASTAIPRELFPIAIEPWKIADDADQPPAIRNSIDRFNEIILLRQQFHREITEISAST